jgi:hypothetical protein
MAERFFIKNDINKSLDYIRERSETVYWKFLDIIQPIVAMHDENGVENLLLLLSNINDFIVTVGVGPELDHDLMWFHLFESDEKGDPIEVIVFVIIDFTTNEVFDASDNIKSFTRH